MTCWLTKIGARWSSCQGMTARLENSKEVAHLFPWHCAPLCGLWSRSWQAALKQVSAKSGKAPKLINFLCQMGQREDITALGQAGDIRYTRVSLPLEVVQHRAEHLEAMPKGTITKGKIRVEDLQHCREESLLLHSDHHPVLCEALQGAAVFVPSGVGFCPGSKGSKETWTSWEETKVGTIWLLGDSHLKNHWKVWNTLWAVEF